MKIWLLYLLALAAVAGAYFAPRIGQDPAYHAFADQRTLAGVPHFWNVISNAPFLLVGSYGVWAWRRANWQYHNDRWAWLVVALSGFLIGIGSGYYHYDPNNQTLFWDRLPMTLGFMGVFSAVIAERVSARAGWWLLAPFLVWGVASVEIWRRSELAGAGDLRMYALVQFYPMLAIPLMLWLFPPRYTASHRIWEMILWYVAAKILEALDVPIHRATGLQMSGHALKHVAAAMALWSPLRMLRERTPSA
ncbi:MAG TPA: ceramidase domain-containing protein [Bryobacteraceae bacterium]|nr:ceramidase domain-containing protein [Bryobacteraceae bacterium]